MICIGLSPEEKKMAVLRYMKENPEIRHVVVFHPDGWDTVDVEAERYTFSESILYRVFYPLLQKIDSSYLIVYDEVMRTPKRNALEYSCMHKYSNQTPHSMAFQQFPTLGSPEDIMILADLTDARMHRRPYSPDVLTGLDMHVSPVRYVLGVELTKLPPSAHSEYAQKKAALFDGLGNKDPDTIPNALELFVGRWKHPRPEDVARNRRYKTRTFREPLKTDRARLIDLPLSCRDLTDWVTLSGCRDMTFVHTGLGVDTYLYRKYAEFFKEVNAFGVKAGI
jgi:hypothetical protein